MPKPRIGGSEAVVESFDEEGVRSLVLGAAVEGSGRMHAPYPFVRMLEANAGLDSTLVKMYQRSFGSCRHRIVFMKRGDTLEPGFGTDPQLSKQSVLLIQSIGDPMGRILFRV